MRCRRDRIEGLEHLPDESRPDRGLSPELCGAIGHCLHPIQIAVLACYVNPIHPDKTRRRELLDWFKHHLRCAKVLGAPLVGLEIGSRHSDYRLDPANSSPAAFEESCESIGELVAEAQRQNICVGIERGAMVHTAPGLGQLDYGHLLQLHAQYWPDRPMILEETTALTLVRSLEILRRLHDSVRGQNDLH